LPDPASITIQDVEGFLVPQPYSEGQSINLAEATVLNQVLVENCRNNYRAKVKAAIAGEEGAGSLDEVVAAFNEMAAAYKFTLATASATRKYEPWEREARSMAKTAIKGALAEAENAAAAAEFNALDDDGKKDWIEARIDPILEANPDIAKQAKKIVAARQNVAKISLAGG
jgi:hypothetical protein